MIEIVRAENDADVACVRELFAQYARELDEPQCFAGFAEELERLPGEYAPPAGRLYLAREGDRAVGCVGLRPLDAASAEMKRLYVRPGTRAAGLGRLLVREVVEAAREIGYARLLLDTLPKLQAAAKLYRSLGFREVPPYLAHPTPGAICFELRL